MRRVFIKLNLLFFLLAAPAVGYWAAFRTYEPDLQLKSEQMITQTAETEEHLRQFQHRLADTTPSLDMISQSLAKIYEAIETEKADYEETGTLISDLIASSRQQIAQTEDVLGEILSKKLGEPIGQTFGKRAAIKVYSLQESGYRGYMAKVKLHDPSALKLVLANDQVRSRGETTSAAAKRTGAVLAINAGGFMSVGSGQIAPVGITVVDGEVMTFSDDERLSFVGFNKQGRLVGSTITAREQLEEMEVLQGASFLPTLLRDGKKQPIPKDWANRREPRTLIGHFSNGDILFIVIDGRRKNWSSGVTLEEAQDKLLEFNVTDAYNLDGGGSSTFYYDGKVLNKPSDGSERRVTTNFVILP
jgi:exopolysaccharide biosynthesis protein